VLGIISVITIYITWQNVKSSC